MTSTGATGETPATDGTAAGAGTADFVFSSAMDLQMKLANDGFAREVVRMRSLGPSIAVVSVR